MRCQICSMRMPGWGECQHCRYTSRGDGVNHFEFRGDRKEQWRTFCRNAGREFNEGTWEEDYLAHVLGIRKAFWRRKREKEERDRIEAAEAKPPVKEDKKAKFMTGRLTSQPGTHV